MKKSIAIFACLLLLGPLVISTPVQALEPKNVASVFNKYVKDKGLADPSVVVIDEATGEIAFEKNANSLRKPASLQKLFTGIAAVMHLDMNQKFSTSVWSGIDSKTVVIQGSHDPWASPYSKSAKEMGRTSLPKIEYYAQKTLNQLDVGSHSHPTIYYSKLFPGDIATLQAIFRKNGVSPKMKAVTSQEAIAMSSTQVFHSTSPTLSEILAFTLEWSDNVLAERIARIASSAAGNGFTEAGVEQTFADVLTHFDLDASKIVVKDASGLSKKNRVTALQVGELLAKIHDDEKFAPVIDGLPVGGVTGTLRKRFIKTAPNAIGLVKAKTGSLNGTANMAGYVESENHLYAFVIIADKLPRSHSAAEKARAIMDKILGKIAAPFIALLNLGEPEIAVASSEKP